MSQPLIYIILPVYNGGEFFVQQLYTIKSQIYNNWHLIIINDGSTDNTESIIQEFIKRNNLEKNITTISQKNTGQYAACGVGLEKVKELCKGKYDGVYIAYCDADDLWTNNKLLEQINFMEEHPNCDLSYHDTYLINQHNQIIGLSSLYYFQTFGKRMDASSFFEICMGGCAISTTMVFKASRINKILPVHPTFSQDRWVLLILSGWNAKIDKIDEKYAFYRISNQSSLATKRKTQTHKDWSNNYLNVLQSLTGRIKKSNIKILNNSIEYNKLRIALLDKPLLYRLSAIGIKFPKIFVYIYIKTFLINQKEYLHLINKYKKLLKIKS